MSITDELRHNIEGAEQLYGCECKHLLAIADRIDAEHEESIQREHESAYDAGYAEGMGVANKADMRAEYLRGKNDGYDDGFASADDWLAQHEDAMAEHGWIKGPLDADGKMWRSGDMSDSNWGVIEGIAYEDGRWLVSGHDTSAPWVPADSIRHYHAPTVEDVLCDLLNEYRENECTLEEARLSEYAAKLRLAEGEDA